MERDLKKEIEQQQKRLNTVKNKIISLDNKIILIQSITIIILSIDLYLETKNFSSIIVGSLTATLLIWQIVRIIKRFLNKVK